MRLSGAGRGPGPRQQQASRATLLLLFMIIMLYDSIMLRVSAGPSAEGQKDASANKKDGLKLFEQTMSWSTDELMRIRNLQSKDVSDRQEFLNASNLAQYLGLAPIQSIHMPVPMTFVFVGFAADGNMGVNYTTEQLQAWFGHLDHVLPHHRIELADLSCVEDGHCTGLVHGQFKAKPVHSSVHLNLTCQVVLVKKRSVMAAFERAIHVFSRPVDPEIESGAQQVDATKMEAFIDHFLDSLGLSAQYSFLVLNPTWTATEPMYGYRTGISQRELEHISLAGVEQVRNLLQQAEEPEPELPSSVKSRGRWGGGGWFRPQAEDAKFHVNDATWTSDFWVNEVDGYLKKEEDFRSAMLKRVTSTKGAAAVVQAVRVLRRMHGPLSATLRDHILGDPHASAAKLLSRFRTMHPAEDCLVGVWVGHQRWLLLDLTADGGDWGPAMGGDGVVHKHTLPKVMTHFSRLAEEKKEKRKKVRYDGSHESDQFKAFQEEKSQALSSTSNNEYQAFLVKRQAWEHEAQAPGAPAMDFKMELEKWGKKYREALARAELDTIERFALNHCHEQLYPPLLCADLKEDADKLRTQLAKMTSSGADTTELYPKHMWDIFGFGQHLSDDFLQLGDSSSRSRAQFMAELSGVLSKGIRHVITPPTAVWYHDAKSRHDTATPYAKHVSFEIYSIHETSRRLSQSQVSSIFELEAFKEQVNELRLQGAASEGQTFDFHVHPINLLEDAAMAAALAVSLRTAQQEIPSSDEYMEGDTERMFVDSRELAHHLRPLLAARALSKRQQSGLGKDHLVVPVLIFQLERSTAVLVDEHYSAKALEDMLLVVQNAAREDEHPTGMMCNGALLSRPLSPLKEALAAVLTFLGGVLPPHIGYSPARKHVAHDWLWSVGAHPFSATATGLEYTQIQKDALARSYLLDAMDSALEHVNLGVAALHNAHTTHALHNHVVKSKMQVKDLLTKYDTLVRMWRTMVGHALLLEFASATDQIQGMMRTALEFQKLCVDLTTQVEHLKCMGRTQDPSLTLVRMVMSASAGIALLAGVIAVFPRFGGRRGRKTAKHQW